MNPNNQQDAKESPMKNLANHKPPIKRSNDPALPFGPEAVASTMECTGLIPSLPMTEGQADAYKEIYDVPCQQQDAMDTPCQWDTEKRIDPKDKTQEV